MSLTQIVSRLEGRSGPSIAETIGAMVTDGSLATGDQLPTVRALASQLGVSPSTVAEAWRTLRGHGIIETDRRRGTTIRQRPTNEGGRYWHVPVEPGTLAEDLSTGTPDPALLPALSTALGQVQIDLSVSSYLDAPVVPELATALTESWPFPPAALTVVNGAQDALDRLIGGTVRFGDCVVVEDPTFPPLLDLLNLAGATIIGVPLTADGIEPNALAQALESNPTTIFMQPRAHNPTGISLTADRADTLAGLLEDSNTLIIEDDHSGSVAGADLHSIGVRLPHQTVHVRSFSKSHGPDLRLAAIGGATAPIEAVVRRRQLGSSWTSRLLQRVLLNLLRDDHVRRQVAHADSTYTDRRTRLVEALVNHGMDLDFAGSGLNLWIPVDDEHDTAVALAAQGIGVAPGSPFEVGNPKQQHVRITISTLSDDVTHLADAIAKASKSKAHRNTGA